MKVVWVIFLLLLSFSVFSQDASDITRENPRQFINNPNCHSFYTPYEPEALIPFNDGSGFKLNQAHLDKNFKNEAKRLWDQYGEDYFYQGRFVLTGIDMQDAKAAKLKYLNYLSEIGLDASKVDLQVMSYPFAKVTGLNKSSLKAAINKMKYHVLPSKTHDFQKVYFKQKTLKTLESTAWIETLGLVMTGMSESLSTPEKASLIASNLALFYLYAKYKDSWLNWLFRPGSNKVIGFAKQVSLSIPFVISYNLFGNISDITQYLTSVGVTADLLPALGAQVQAILPFAFKTAVLAGMWHRFVNTDIFGAWYNGQKSLGSIQELKAFKTMEKTMRVFGVPFSVMFLFSALPATQTILDLGIGGLGTFNSGHIQMLVYTAATVATFRIYKAMTGVSLMDKINATPSLPKLLKIWKSQLKKFSKRVKAGLKKRTPSR